MEERRLAAIAAAILAGAITLDLMVASHRRGLMANTKAEDKASVVDQSIISIWERAVQTQMHFNEMSVKSRQLGLTFVAAALGVAVFLFTRDSNLNHDVTMWGRVVHFHVAVFIILHRFSL